MLSIKAEFAFPNVENNIHIIRRTGQTIVFHKIISCTLPLTQKIRGGQLLQKLLICSGKVLMFAVAKSQTFSRHIANCTLPPRY
jgi:hypothetical protein